MKLWQKATTTDEAVLAFTIGRDPEMDLRLAPFDLLGSLAHVQMLGKVGLLTTEETTLLQRELRLLYRETEAGSFRINPGVEDVHSQIELLLTERLGPVGERVHAGRSRNDQVALAVRLYLRQAVEAVVIGVGELFALLIAQGQRYQAVLMPGYTHLQVAMPSSFGLWFGAYAESLADDLLLLQAAFHTADRNPLGSAAGYGSSLPLDRELTTILLAFEAPAINSIYAQMGRGKAERTLAVALAGVAATVGRLAMDACLYAGQDYGFIRFPDTLTTGSSIMPHKKNPDVLELVRGHCARLQALPNEFALLLQNLPSGYHRELQLTKEMLFPAIDTLLTCLAMTRLMFSQVEVTQNILAQDKYRYIFSVEAVNERVLAGTPFRQAYREVATAIASGRFTSGSQAHYTHLGSIGNPGFDQIAACHQTLAARFPFARIHTAFEQLLVG